LRVLTPPENNFFTKALENGYATENVRTNVQEDIEYFVLNPVAFFAVLKV
jgi:hypothetical protein